MKRTTALLTYILAGLMVVAVLAIPIGIVVILVWVGVITNPAVLKLLGGMAVILVVGLAWATATTEKKNTPDS